jgi:serine/threonine protein kinase
MGTSCLGTRFEIGELIASGGMARVHQARDRQTGARVAVKLVDANNGEATARFWHEARFLSLIRHRNVIRYVDHGRLASLGLALVTEWLDGETLGRLARGDLEPAEAVAIVRQAAAGIAQAHARHVVHCDLKPSNLFLVDGSPDQVKVLDFGIARRADDARATPIAGTPGYMAPEQWLGSPVDARADVYALGCILFRCLAGRVPFPGSVPAQILYRVMIEGTPRLSAMRRDLPPELYDLVSGMLARDPANRPASAATVGTCLARLGLPGAPARLAKGTLVVHRSLVTGD